MLRIIVISLFSLFFYTACFFCPGLPQEQERFERDVSGFLGKTYTGKLKTPDGKIFAFEFDIGLQKASMLHRMSWGNVAYATSCSLSVVYVSGTLKSAESPSLNFAFSGYMEDFDEKEMRLATDEDSPREPTCHILRIGINRTAQFISGSYKYNPKCGEATLKEAVITELKPK